MDIRTFITSGNATGTLTSLKSGAHFTFKFRKVQDRNDRFFVSLLTGPNNEEDYSYAGLMHIHSGSGHLSFQVTGKSCVGNDCISVKALRWALAKVNRGEALDPQGKFQHEGRCGRCGRKLTHPESIETGLGPECAAKV